MKFSIKDLVLYTRKFYGYAGKKMYVLFILGFFPGITDSIGITMLLPLLLATDPGGGAPAVNFGESDFAFKILDVFNIPQELTYVLLFIAGIYVLKFLISVAEATMRSYIISNMVKQIRDQLLGSYISMNYLYYVQKNTGYFINLINLQSNSLVTGYLYVSQFYAKLFTSLAYLSFAFYMDWEFSIISLGAGLFLVYFLRKFNQIVKKLSIKTTTESFVLSNLFIQLLQGYKYIKATSAFGRLSPKLNKSINNLRDYKFKGDNVHAIYKATNEPLAVIMVLLLIYVQVFILGKSINTLIINIFLFYRTVSNLLVTQTQWQTVLTNSGGMESVEEEFAEGVKHLEPNGSKPLKEFNENIVFHDVHFRYPANESDVIKHLDITIPKNLTVAFVGESGAGKSTLTDLLSFILKPYKGSITIDGTSLSEIDIHTWRSRIGFVSQDVVLFDDTIANNISMWAVANNPGEMKNVEAAAKLAHCHEFIIRLPEGYQTKIGERGMKLSGGQKQRLSIARELYKNPELLILDEATSALDSESENLIQQSIKELKGKFTVVVIAHRLSTIKDADVIYVMNRGEIMESGSYDDLIRLENGKFKKMVEYQTL